MEIIDLREEIDRKTNFIREMEKKLDNSILENKKISNRRQGSLIYDIVYA